VPEHHFTRAKIVSALQALDLLERMYPLQEPPAKTRFFLEELFGAMPSS